MEQGLCNGWMSHQLSPVYQLLQQHVAGLLLGALQAVDTIDSGGCPAATTPPQHNTHSTAVSSKCEQCHVYSHCRKLNTGLLVNNLMHVNQYVLCVV